MVIALNFEISAPIHPGTLGSSGPPFLISHFFHHLIKDKKKCPKSTVKCTFSELIKTHLIEYSGPGCWKKLLLLASEGILLGFLLSRLLDNSPGRSAWS